jgi:hypothetical protein
LRRPSPSEAAIASSAKAISSHHRGFVCSRINVRSAIWPLASTDTSYGTTPAKNCEHLRLGSRTQIVGIELQFPLQRPLDGSAPFCCVRCEDKSAWLPSSPNQLKPPLMLLDDADCMLEARAR